MENIRQTVKRVWGYDALLPLQEGAIGAVLARRDSIVQAMMKNVPAGVKPMAVKQGIDKTVEAVVDERTPRTKPTPMEERDRPRSNDLGERGATLNQPCEEE